MQTIDVYENKMKQSIESFLIELSQIYIGKINSNILKKIYIEYYNVMTNISQIAKITNLDSKILEIEPWDINTISLIEKAIQKSDLGINPQNNGKTIRLIFPSLTKEKRLTIIKEIKKISEKFKTNIRNIRRIANADLKKDKNNTEDMIKLLEKSIQNMTDKYSHEIDNITKNKEIEIIKI